MLLQCKSVLRELACYDFSSFNHFVKLSMGLGGAEQALLALGSSFVKKMFIFTRAIGAREPFRSDPTF